ncbi:MAG TPA: hypothetical protein VE984_12835 [Gaiellaceae bacterium]|nr:hypothetical protein [Gaiellaceae bacterium]
MAIRVLNTAAEGGIREMEARKANDRIAAKAEQLRFVSRVPMLCECSDPDCRTVVLISLDDYRHVREDDSFLTAPGHPAEGAELERRTQDYDVHRVADRDESDGDRRSA